MIARIISSIRALITAIVRRIRGTTSTLTAQVQAAAETAPMIKRAKERRSQHDRRRSELHACLRRTDGGGNHYGSKRALSNHRGSQRGKRTGRS